MLANKSHYLKGGPEVAGSRPFKMNWLVEAMSKLKHGEFPRCVVFLQHIASAHLFFFCILLITKA
jgi:hypothetical protein